RLSFYTCGAPAPRWGTPAVRASPVCFRRRIPRRTHSGKGTEMNLRLLAAAALVLSFVACGKTDESTAPSDTATTATPQEQTPAAITPVGADTFAMPAKLQTTPSGLQYAIDQPGTGAKPQAGQRVFVHYTGWLTDGTK